LTIPPIRYTLYAMLIIDGHNLLRSIQNTDDESASLTDLQLCDLLSRYLQSIREEGEIIFDGSGPSSKHPYENIEKLEVIFAGQSSDADTVIENRIKSDPSPRRLLIVSSDLRLRDAARVNKSQSVKSDAFWLSIKKELNRRQKRQEPRAKRTGISESETEQWMKAFGFEQ